MKEIKTALVLGAGTMGHGFAQVFAVNGVEVFLVDQAEEFLEKARGWIAENLNTMLELGEIEQERIASTLARIRYSTDLRQAASQTDYVLEAVFEDLDLKKKMFQQLDAHTRPDVVLATNTSSFDINELCRVIRHPERVIGTHWFHPPQITPCVEVIPSDVTNQATIDCACNLMEQIGKVPTLCKSAPGFVANRIQLAMAAEACAIVEEGLATPEEVDRIVKTSFGFRLSAYGPCEVVDQAGADTYYAVYEYLYDKLKRDHFRPPGILRKMIEQGHYGLKTGRGFYDYKAGAGDTMKRERDRKLYRRLRLLREEQKAEESKS